MPMIIETGPIRPGPKRSRLTDFRLPLAGIALTLAVWFGGMAIAAYAFDPAIVIVFAPGRTGVDAILAADGTPLRSGTGFATGRSTHAGFVRRLYARGAWFVWPSLTPGCFAPDRFVR